MSSYAEEFIHVAHQAWHKVKKEKKKEKDLIEEFIDVAHQAWHQGEEERKNKKK